MRLSWVTRASCYFHVNNSFLREPPRQPRSTLVKQPPGLQRRPRVHRDHVRSMLLWRLPLALECCGVAATRGQPVRGALAAVAKHNCWQSATVPINPPLVLQPPPASHSCRPRRRPHLQPQHPSPPNPAPGHRLSVNDRTGSTTACPNCGTERCHGRHISLARLRCRGQASRSLDSVNRHALQIDSAAWPEQTMGGGNRPERVEQVVKCVEAAEHGPC